MLTLLAKVLGTKGYKKIKTPSCWEECSTEMYQRIAKEWDGSDQIKLFSIMSGHDYDAVRESKSKNLEATFWQVIQFVYQQHVEWSQLKAPQFFKVAGKTIEIPKNLGRLSLGQNIAVRQAMERVVAGFSPDMLKWMSQKDFVFDEIMSYATAVYLQPIIDNAPFDDGRAAEIEREIMAMPILRVYPIGFFFLNQVSNSGKSLGRQWNLRSLISALNPFRGGLKSLKLLAMIKWLPFEISSISTNLLLVGQWTRTSFTIKASTGFVPGA